MKVGDDIIIRAKVVDIDNDHNGSSVKVEIKGFMNSEDVVCLLPFEDPIRFWINRMDMDDVVVEDK